MPKLLPLYKQLPQSQTLLCLTEVLQQHWPLVRMGKYYMLPMPEIIQLPLSIPDVRRKAHMGLLPAADFPGQCVLTDTMYLLVMSHLLNRGRCRKSYFLTTKPSWTRIL